MSVRNFASLFRPRSIAVIGAAANDTSAGSMVMRNLLSGGFNGPIMPVTPKATSVAGVLAYKNIAALPVVPDLAVICSPWDQIAEQIALLGLRGTHAVIVTTPRPGFSEDEKTRSAAEEFARVARSYNVRLLGPGSMGLMVPAYGLNASTAPQPARPGRIAFVSQSGALCAAVLDWAKPKGIGFSHFISLGGAVDVGFGDVLDYLGSDPMTRAILLYVETIRERRNFMSAARAAARNKPVLAIKAGRVAQSAQAAALHTGTLAEADAVFDAAIRRAGMLRVYDLDEMFTAVETLSRTRPMRGDKLSIVTNGGGIGVMAVDEFASAGGELTDLAPTTVERLSKVLPKGWPQGNPIDIGDDADGERYRQTMDALLDSDEVETVMVMHAPMPSAAPLAVAEAVAESAKAHKGNVMACWVGQESAEAARHHLQDAGIPCYETPGAAVRAFMHLVDYRRNHDMLRETPPSALEHFVPDLKTARAIVEGALSGGNGFLSEPEAKAVLAAYGIPTVETHIAATPEEAGEIARRMAGPVALKVLSPDAPHKSDVGGVMLSLEGAEDVANAARLMLDKIGRRFPDIRIEGFTVQRMVRRASAQEIIIGVTTDRIFGPVIMFGQGGVAVEVINDSAFALPPLNMTLARELVSRTRVSKLLEGYRGWPPANIDAICEALMKVSQLIIDIPEIAGLDINPLFADADGVLALDAGILVVTPVPGERLAIRPYPKELEEVVDLADGRKCLIRPIRPEDEPNHHVFVSRLSPEDIRFRFFGRVSALPHSEMARLTQIDYDREMAFIASVDENGSAETLGVVRVAFDPDNETAEFAVVVRSGLRGGLGRILMKKMIDYCRKRRTGKMIGQVLADNVRMLKFVETLGFKRIKYIEGDTVEVALNLQSEQTQS